MLKRFFEDERGLEAIEYTVMTTLIVGALVSVLSLVAVAITNRFDLVSDII